MPRPPTEYSEQRPAVGDEIDTARGVYENSRSLNDLALRTFRDVKTKGASYSMDPVLDRVVITSTGNITITLPDPSDADHVAYTVVAGSVTGGAVTVSTPSGTISHASNSTVSLSTQYDRVTVVSDGTNYFRID